MPEPLRGFVGLDWGSDAHAVCLLDASGGVQDEQLVPHRMEAIVAWIESVLARTGVPASAIGIGIETPRGVLVDTLLDRGFSVFAINPKQLDRFRDRFSAAGAKDDRRDAHVLGDALRTDPQAFRAVQLSDPRILELRELSRAEEDWKRDLSRFTNRLREQLLRVAPRLVALCPAANEAWFWALIEATGPFTAARVPSKATVRALLKRYRIRRVSADDVWAVLQGREFVVAQGVAAGVRLRVEGIIAQARLTAAHQRQCIQQIDRLLAALAEADATAEPSEHRDVEILLSLPGVGRLTTATMLTEAARPIADRDYPMLRAWSGSAPVTRRSGKRLHTVMMRRACNPRLRLAVYHWGCNSLQRDPPTRAYYDALRRRGHSHGRALRAVADRWFRILIAMLTHRTLYDVSRFTVSTEAA